MSRGTVAKGTGDVRVGNRIALKEEARPLRLEELQHFRIDLTVARKSVRHLVGQDRASGIGAFHTVDRARRMTGMVEQDLRFQKLGGSNLGKDVPGDFFGQSQRVAAIERRLLTEVEFRLSPSRGGNRGQRERRRRDKSTHT